jgi:hypothetical protein
MMKIFKKKFTIKCSKKLENINQTDFSKLFSIPAEKLIILTTSQTIKFQRKKKIQAITKIQAKMLCMIRIKK